MTPEQETLVVEMAYDGMSYAQISRIIEVDENEIEQIVLKHKVERA